MTFRQLHLSLLLLLLLTLLLVACDAATNSTAATAEPTNVRIALAQTFSAPTTFGGTISVQYPADWFDLYDGTLVQLTNDEAVFGPDVSTFEPGQIGISILFIPDAAIGQFVVDPDNATSENVLFGFLSTVGMGDSFDTAQDVILGGYAGVESQLIGARDDTIALALDKENGYVLMIAGTAGGEIDEQLELIETIAVNVSYESSSTDTEDTQAAE